MFSQVLKRLAGTSANQSSKMKCFFEPKIQDTLQSLVSVQYEKLFRVSKRGQKVAPPTYVFMTNEQLRKAQMEAQNKAKKLLQIPPVLDERTDDHLKILEKDPAMVGFDSANYVFTDITYGIHDRDRIIVAREPDGTLREATGAERDRMNQIYFPKEGRYIKTPILFEPTVLEGMLGPDKYVYVLDRNCVQFEPDHPIYIRTCSIVFDHLDINGHYEVLQSTRHYGALLFHLTYEKRTDNIILHYLKKLDLESSSKIVYLYTMIHPESRMSSAMEPDNEEARLKLLRTYIKEESKKETKLHMALETALETIQKNLQSTMKLNEQHGQ